MGIIDTKLCVEKMFSSIRDSILDLHSKHYDQQQWGNRSCYNKKAYIYYLYIYLKSEVQELVRYGNTLEEALEIVEFEKYECLFKNLEDNSSWDCNEEPPATKQSFCYIDFSDYICFKQRVDEAGTSRLEVLEYTCWYYNDVDNMEIGCKYRYIDISGSLLEINFCNEPDFSVSLDEDSVYTLVRDTLVYNGYSYTIDEIKNMVIITRTNTSCYSPRLNIEYVNSVCSTYNDEYKLTKTLKFIKSSDLSNISIDINTLLNLTLEQYAAVPFVLGSYSANSLEAKLQTKLNNYKITINGKDFYVNYTDLDISQIIFNGNDDCIIPYNVSDLSYTAEYTCINEQEYVVPPSRNPITIIISYITNGSSYYRPSTNTTEGKYYYYMAVNVYRDGSNVLYWDIGANAIDYKGVFYPSMTQTQLLALSKTEYINRMEAEIWYSVLTTTIPYIEGYDILQWQRKGSGETTTPVTATLEVIAQNGVKLYPY